MKRILKKASVLLVIGLVACTGRTITREQAITILQDIKTKQSEEGFVYATDFSITVKMVLSAANGNSAEQTSTLSYNAEQKRAKYDVHIIQETGSSSTEQIETQWIYVENSSMYQVVENTINGEAPTKNYVTTSEDVDAKWAEIVTSIQNMFNSNISDTDNPDYFLGILNGSFDLGDGTTTVTINSELYTTTGDGNITAAIIGRVTSEESDGGGQAGNMSVNFSFDNYRITQSFISVNVDQTSTQDELNHMSRQSSYLYSNINIALPDLTGFTEASNQ